MDRVLYLNAKKTAVREWLRIIKNLFFVICFLLLCARNTFAFYESFNCEQSVNGKQAYSIGNQKRGSLIILENADRELSKSRNRNVFLQYFPEMVAVDIIPINNIYYFRSNLYQSPENSLSNILYANIKLKNLMDEYSRLRKGVDFGTYKKKRLTDSNFKSSVSSQPFAKENPIRLQDLSQLSTHQEARRIRSAQDSLIATSDQSLHPSFLRNSTFQEPYKSTPSLHFNQPSSTQIQISDTSPLTEILENRNNSNSGTGVGADSIAQNKNMINELNNKNETPKSDKVYVPESPMEKFFNWSIDYIRNNKFEFCIYFIGIVFAVEVLASAMRR